MVLKVADKIYLIVKFYFSEFDFSKVCMLGYGYMTDFSLDGQVFVLFFEFSLHAIDLLCQLHLLFLIENDLLL